MIQYKGQPAIHTIVLHDTAVSRATQGEQLQAVNNHHKGNWNMKSELGWYVGYNFFCEASGGRTQTRLVGEETVAQIGNNCDVPSRCGMVSYCMAGYFAVEKPTTLQIADFVAFVEEIRSKYPDAVIKQHKDVYPGRTCAELSAEEIESWFAGPGDTNDELLATIEKLKKQNVQLVGMVKTLLAYIMK